MKHFDRDQIQAYLRALDKNAPKGVAVVIIGGAAATLSYGAKGGTIDIDTANNVKALDQAIEAARKETGLAIPFARATVFDAPCDYKSRVQKVVLRDLEKLTVLVPEKHDWALMKIVRYEDKDAAHVKAASESVGFDRKIFEERFLSEMTHIEPQARLVIHFLAMMEELYGEEEAARMQRLIKADKRWK